MTSIYLNSKSYDPKRSSKVPLEWEKVEQKVEAKSRIRMSDISRFIFKFNAFCTFVDKCFQICQLFCRTFFAGLENSMTIYLFHLILIILDNINSFPNILFQASKFKF